MLGFTKLQWSNVPKQNRRFYALCIITGKRIFQGLKKVKTVKERRGTMHHGTCMDMMDNMNQ